jgi:hypothetical protein
MNLDRGKQAYVMNYMHEYVECVSAICFFFTWCMRACFGRLNGSLSMYT